ncbi:E3 ubiquitin-protein ligase Iruka isoform X2 [Bemisia tabaci]|uniref:E3 ubiquitin-protein ligase Iruka isoform X2 n=1 Tax=Bemisia tabaci TaxID=7038 RepID=UPI0008F9D369|nr:PREDICTED: E3 ubiquitin-protein ligase RNF115 isoform X2 [Bemisia tabaci]
MAEASSVENLALNRFYCHICNSEISRALPDFTCPTCHNGFIEMLEPADEEPDEIQDALQDFLEFQEELAARRMRRMFRRNRGNSSSLRLPHSTWRDSNMSGSNMAPLSRGRTSSSTSGGSGGLRPRRSRRQALNEPRTEPIEALVQELLFEFSGGAVDARGGNAPVFFLSNPGDYAWGREGLDAIVTMLLNQMEVSGPPPLSTEKIQEIPVVVITQAQVDSSLQCSVCWEDFKFEEPVRKLACDHVYHEPCIIPWLELHGTCPICRKTLNEDGTVSDPSNSNPEVNNLEAFFRGQGRSTSSVSSSTGASSSASQSSVIPDSFNMDLEYD